MTSTQHQLFDIFLDDACANLSSAGILAPPHTCDSVVEPASLTGEFHRFISGIGSPLSDRAEAAEVAPARRQVAPTATWHASQSPDGSEPVPPGSSLLRNACHQICSTDASAPITGRAARRLRGIHRASLGWCAPTISPRWRSRPAALVAMAELAGWLCRR